VAEADRAATGVDTDDVTLEELEDEGTVKAMEEAGERVSYTGELEPNEDEGEGAGSETDGAGVREGAS